MNKYSLSQAAIRDLDEISDYFSNFSVEVGERFIKRFDDQCKNLINFPKMGRSYAQIIPNLRGVPLDSYIIFYQVTEVEIEIVRIVSGYRNLESLFGSDINN
ncbi:type II toxin-antitoxin system RelE/ParE family toxin [Okeania sp. SIO2B3]|uniref:type II toxin-antitoxin system RelE/ParE family toxin n=1 Tax=Okeania sp. SIO2B3 TaxID=2607784 RepID=UPI0013BF7B6A|nr:type II toxin-antitoxin system RelE/ParE family toxin [Okeania sp. SIO2B3]NET43875.1 type II toxin-antitoxin system RelE/ParE family toxin [Okeania sp. SIO2B3]